MFAGREVFDTEKSRLRSQLESLQHSFETVKKQYSEVEVWQRHLQEGNIKLLTEKGKLHATYVLSDDNDNLKNVSGV